MKDSETGHFNGRILNICNVINCRRDVRTYCAPCFKREK